MDMKMTVPLGPQSVQKLGRKAFTLTELLVVIALILILTALLLSVLSRARAQAHSTACKNHLRQIGFALATYVSDSGRYPPLSDRVTRQMWADRLYPHYPLNWTNRFWHCPTYIANKGLVGIWGTNAAYQSKPWTSYSYNGGGIIGDGWSGIPASITTLQFGLGMRPHLAPGEFEMVAPSEMYVVADARPFRPGATGWRMPAPDGTLGSFRMTPWLEPWPMPVKEMKPPHGQGYNLLFGDGHVVQVNRSDYLSPPRTAHHWNRDNQPHPEAWAPRDYWAVQN